MMTLKSLALTAMVLLVPAHSFGQCQSMRFESPVYAPATTFGSDVALDGDIAVIGHHERDRLAGAAYITERVGDQWTELTELDCEEAWAPRNFGWDVAVDADTVIVGAWRDSEHGHSSGAAYIFRRTDSGWVREAKLTPDDAREGLAFGWAVAVHGETAIVSQGETPGGVYVFERQSDNTWLQTAWLRPADIRGNDAFGHKIAIDHDTLAAFSYNQQGTGYPGSVYVYRRDAGVWTVEQELSASAPQNGSLFGYAIDISADRLVAGAPNFTELGTSRIGEAYLFERSGGVWTEVQTLRPEWVDSAIHFGRGIAIAGGTVLVGAFQDSGPGGDYTGSAFLFRERDAGWDFARRVFSTPPVEGAGFAETIGFDADSAIFGARLEGYPGPDGAAYIVGGFRADCNADGAVDTLDVLCFLNLWTAADPGADCNADGTVDTLDVLCFLNAWNQGC